MNEKIRVFKIKFDPKLINTEVLNAAFWDADHLGIEEKEEHLLVYFKDRTFSKSDILAILEQFGLQEEVEVKDYVLKEENWNQIWETNFEPISIKNKIYIRADFHPSKPDMQELIIQPKMAFGTGHHETTRGMIELMMENDFSKRSVLDMGCGTGVLGIYALKSKAQFVDFIDNDKWCYENTIENLQKNYLPKQNVFLTDCIDNGKKYDIILANIHKNVILKQHIDYKNHLQSNGLLFISGFYEDDKNDILHQADQLGLHFEKENIVEDWCILKLKNN